MARSKEQQSDCQRRTNDNQFYCDNRCNRSIYPLEVRSQEESAVLECGAGRDLASNCTSAKPENEVVFRDKDDHLPGTQDGVAWGWPRQAAAKRVNERRKACMFELDDVSSPIC